MKCPTCASKIPDGESQCPACTTPWVYVSDDTASGSTAATAPVSGPFPPGHVLAERYRIVRLLGRGGMGEVYQAEDLKLGQAVALKFLPRDRRDRLRLQMLFNEVRLARRIAHRNVCRMYDVVEAEGLVFLAMEYVDGENLAALLHRIGRLPQERALILAIELCRGLEAAHQRGILHRDLKPANLMLDTSGHIRITDFGLAWLFGSGTESRADSPLASVRAGTPGYMAPEQRLGREVTVRSDLYALGLVIYELFTGRRVLPQGGAGLRAEPEAPEPLSRWVEGLSEDVERVILACLESEPERRPASAGEVAAALEQYAAPPWRPRPGEEVPPRPSWRLERRLGAGGFGEAWLARHETTRDARVFKFCYQASHLQALKREITVFRLIKEELGERDDITRILDWNFAEPPWFIESEFTESGHIEAWAAERGGLAAVALEQRLEIVAQVATALAAAHSIGVLHKDVKPSNVLIRRDVEGRPRAQLADFGIGMVLERERLDRAGITVLGFTELTETTPSSYGGTRIYMAPELLEGKATTLQADIYALGVMLYQMVVGDFSRALAPGWQREVDDELLRDDIAAAVEGRPQRRLADAAQLAERLRTLPERRAERERKRQAEAQARATREALARARRRRRLGAAVLAAALAVTALTLFEARRQARDAARKRNVAHLAVAGQRMDKNPTQAALVLLEVDDPAFDDDVDVGLRRALRRQLAFAELRHAGFVTSATWSGDGTRLLTSSTDTTARIWDAASGRPTHILRHSQPIRRAAWSPDGTRVATASDDRTARLWTLAAIDRPTVLEGHDSGLLWVAWSPSGRLVATASDDRTARVWEAETGEQLFVLAAHTARVRMAAWGRDDRRLVTVGDDSWARVWELGDDGAEPAVLKQLHHGGEWVWMAAWSHDGRRLATAPNNLRARVWGVVEGAGFVALGEGTDSVRMAAWSRGDGRLATASEDGTVRIWPGSPTPGAQPVELRGHEGRVWTVAWSRDGERLLSTSDDETARVWPVGPGSDAEALVLRGHGGHVEMGDWSPDGRWVVTASVDETALVWRPGSRGDAIVLAHGAPIQQVLWSGDDRFLATVGADAAARVWPVDDLVTKPPADDPAPDEATVAAPARAVAWSTDGRLLTYSNDAVRALDPTGNGAFDAPGAVHAATDPAPEITAWSPDAHRVVAARGDATLEIVSAEAEPTRLAARLPAAAKLVRWSPDGRRLLASTRTSVHVLTVVGDAVRRAAVLQGHSAPIHDAAWSGDSRRVVTASEDATARIWRVEPGPATVEQAPPAAPLHVFETGGSAVRSVAWGPRGQMVIAGLATGPVLVWRIDEDPSPGASGPSRQGTDAALVLRGHALDVRRIVFSPDGERFATTGTAGRVLVWDFVQVRAAGPWNGAARRDGVPRRVQARVVLEGHGEAVEAMAWSGDGRHLATASRDGTARVWWLVLDDLRAQVRSATRMCLDPVFREYVLGESAEEARRRYQDCASLRGSSWTDD